MAIEMVDFPMKTGDLSIAMLNYQRVAGSFFLFGTIVGKGPAELFLNHPFHDIMPFSPPAR